MRVLLAGGGSGGSAAPVIAVAEALSRRNPGAEFLYVTTTDGPERAMVRASGLPSAAIHTGRLRRYATWRNLTDPALVMAGFGEALVHVRRFRPDVAFAAGGFAAVPPLMAARTSRTPLVVHQQDVKPGLANLMLAPFAVERTVALEDTHRWPRWANAPVVGNPVRPAVLAGDVEWARKVFRLRADLPTVLVTGGGTGALRLNEIAAEAAGRLLDRCQIIHLTGTGKAVSGPSDDRYHQIEFLVEEMAHALAVADVIVSRAGMSALAEIGALGKAAILVPMPASHQELNAAAFGRRVAAIVMPEPRLTADSLASAVAALLDDPQRRAALGSAASALLPANAADVIAGRLETVANGG
jgi:UDP-N-acetylglucosamine--N-acetylmuramyl-(pentapeptide) pyrophosphoryl-undecaprenol N-acetylglucosamine transferase